MLLEVGRWAFRKLKEYVESKAEEQSIEVKTVSPKYKATKEKRRAFMFLDS